MNPFLALLSGALIASAHAQITYPDWWQIPPGESLEGEYEIVADGVLVPESDFSPALQGQARYLVERAILQFERYLAFAQDGQGAGGAVLALRDIEYEPNAPILIGQLKSLAAPFYNRMQSLGFQPVNASGAPITLFAHSITVPSGNYPWPDNANGHDSPATLGQLKYVFSFAIEPLVPADDDNLPDEWEVHYFGHADALDGEDADGDGRTNLEEFHAATDPNDFFNGTLPVLTYEGSALQVGHAQESLFQPFAVSVASATGDPLPDAPVMFSTVAEDGGILENGQVLAHLSLRTDASGKALIVGQLGEHRREPIVFTATVETRQWNGSSFDRLIDAKTLHAYTIRSSGVALAAGADHSIFQENGQTRLWGQNRFGEIGIGLANEEATVSEPAFAGSFPSLLTAGRGFTVFVDEDGILQGVGANDFGQLGSVEQAVVLQPTTIKTPSEWRDGETLTVESLDAGDFHVLALLSDGSVWAWGLNEDGQLGSPGISATAEPQEIMNLGSVVGVHTSATSSFAVHQDGRVSAWGSNRHGQLGLSGVRMQPTPETLDLGGAVRSLDGGRNFVLALREDGTLLGLGANAFGQLGQGNTVAASTAQTIAVDPTGSPVVAVAAGERHSLALLYDGTLWAFGAGQEGQIGDGANVNRFRAHLVDADSWYRGVLAGRNHSFGFGPGETLLSWGDNQFGQLGHSPGQSQVSIPGVIDALQQP